MSASYRQILRLVPPSFQKEIRADQRFWIRRLSADKVRSITSDPESWRIDQKGISIVFQQYAVGCYACTPEPFTITWAQLQPLLNPDFVVPAK